MSSPKDLPKANEMGRREAAEGRHVIQRTLQRVEDALPTVASIRATATQVGRGTRPQHRQQDSMAHPGSFRENFDCANPLCYGGGVSIGSIVREMVRRKESTKQVEYLGCKGGEGTRTRRDKPCMNHWNELRVEITYKP